VVQKHTKFPGSIGPMVDAIVPAAKAVYGKPGDFVDNTVRGERQAHDGEDRDQKRDRFTFHQGQ
jgi:hypothetical protein